MTYVAHARLFLIYSQLIQVEIESEGLPLPELEQLVELKIAENDYEYVEDEATFYCPVQTVLKQGEEITPHTSPIMVRIE